MSRRRSPQQNRRFTVKAQTPSVVQTLLVADFSGATLGAMTNASFASTYSLSFSRASAATVQTGASTVDSTPTTDQPRIGSQGAAWGQGLVLEEARTNLLFFSRDPTNVGGWGGGFNTTTTANVGAGPDGNVNACRSQVQATGFSNNQTVSPGAGQIVASQWARANTGTSPYGMLWANGTDPNRSKTGTATTSWGTVSTGSITAAAGTGTFYPCDATDTGVGACDIWTDLAQLEVGQWRSEAIITAGATGTRAGDRLFVTTGSNIISSNRMGLAYTFVGKGTPAQMNGANAFLWNIDASNQAWIDTTQKVNVKLGGVTVTSASAISWAFGDVVDLWVACGAGGNAVVEYRVNSGAATTLLNTALAGNPSGVGNIDLLCSGTTNQLSCWLRTFSAYKTGQQPSWVV